MIRLEQVKKEYNSGKPNHVTALQNIDLLIRPKEFVIVLGANGSGKSTLLNLISGNLFPSSGRILFEGAEVTFLADYKRSRWIARVFQNPLSGTAPELSILDNFRLAAIRTAPKKLSLGIDEKFRDRVKEKISLLGMGLETKLNQSVGSLSGGQRQALTLLMGTMDHAKILLLDEPTAALDPRSAAIVMETADKLIRQYDLTAILVTHNLKDAFNYGNRIIQLSEGKIIRDLDSGNKSKLAEADLFKWFI